MDKPSGADRRGFDRLEAYHLAKYRIADQPEGEWVSANVLNIGGGGVYLRANQELSMSTIINVRILFPGDTGAVNLKAKVVWVKRSQVKNNIYFDSGLQFLDINDKLQKEIIGKIRRVRQKVEPDQKNELEKRRSEE